MKKWINKTMIVLALLLVMAGSLTAGTLAIYTTSIDNLAQGSVTAKEFVFLGEGTDSFSQGIKIAPTETVNWQFGVKNYNGAQVTETDLYYKLNFTVQAASGKKVIDPLTVSVLDSSGAVLKSVKGAGTFDVTGAFPAAKTGQSKGYTVKISWPNDNNNDMKYAGGNYGTTVNVSAAASQLPFDGTQSNQGNVSVLYETSPAWSSGQGGNYQYEYKVTVTNNTDKPIEDWYMTFDLGGDQLTRAYSNAIMVQGSNGSYKFVNPAYNNTATDDIAPGQSITFRGPAVGQGLQPIGNVSVGGSNASAVTASSASRFSVALN